MSDNKETRDKVYHLINQKYTITGYTYVWAKDPQDAIEQISLGNGVVETHPGGFTNDKPTHLADLYEYDLKTQTRRKAEIDLYLLSDSHEVLNGSS